MEFITARLIIRPYRDTDVPLQVAAVRESVQTVGKWLPWCTQYYATADAKKWFATCDRELAVQRAFDFGLFDRETGAVVGSIGLNQIHTDYRIANFGYWIRESRQNQGFATEAAQPMLQFGLGELKLNRIEIIACLKNEASRRVAVKLGATFEGIARNRIVIRGHSLDAAVYSVIPEDHHHV
jgi:ribosomal-protein-serine acetyltransferase